MRSAILSAVVPIIALLLVSSSSEICGQSRTNQSGTGGLSQVRGKVYLPNGQSLDTPVEVELQAVFTTLKVYTDRGGSFVFQNLTAGSYTLVVNAGEQFEPTREYFTIDPDPPPPRGMAVRESPKLLTVPIYLRPRAGVILRNEVINAKWSAIPKEAVEQLKRGVELAQASKPAEAEAALRASIRIAPNFAPAHTELGKLLARTGKLEASLDSFRTAIRHDEADFDAHINLGIVYMNLKQYAEAEPELVAAAYINRTAITPHYYIGLLYFVVRNDLDVAQKAFETAKGLNGGRSLPAIHRYLGLIYMKKDMEKEALQELETYLRLAPKAQDAEKVKKDISDIKAKHIKNAFV